MTLIKSLLLGSAAGIVAVASAQAADLPTRKAAPVEYVKVCNVGGITGWVLPGSDTCVKFSGYITAQFTGGNLNNQFNWSGSVPSAFVSAVDPFFLGKADQRILIEGNEQPTVLRSGLTGLPIRDANGNTIIIPNQRNSTFFRDATGWSTRASFGFDMASNTAWGPLIGHFDINAEAANGFDALNGNTYLNTGYLTWAGITAGKAQSFFSFTGGGDNWANIFSPDRKGFNEPTLLAYTASFGGGFSATLSAESPGPVGNSGGGTRLTGAAGSNPGGIVFGGQRWPDIVGALHVKQPWGEAQVSGVVHDVNVQDSISAGLADCGFLGIVSCNAKENRVGWAVDAGVKVNLPSFGAGDNIIVTGVYSQNAVWYSGLPDGMWGENGQVNGNGQPMYLADAFFNPLTNQWAVPRAWSVTAILEHHFTPQFYVDLEGSVGGINWSNQGGCNVFVLGCTLGSLGAGALSPHATSWIIGADLGWNPVTNLNFDLELMYQDTNQDRPNGFIGTINSNGVFNLGQWEGNSSGFAGRFRITRYF